MEVNPPRCDEAQKVFTCTEPARSQPEREEALPTTPLLDCFQESPDTEALWPKAAFVDKKKGLLALDDTTLDKPYPKKMELVTYHWSGKHQKGRQGHLLTLRWKTVKPSSLATFGFTTNLRVEEPK